LLRALRAHFPAGRGARVRELVPGGTDPRRLDRGAARRDRDRSAPGSIRRYLDQRAASGTVFVQTWLRLVLADACLVVGANTEAIAAVREGLAAVEATEEWVCEAELHRMHATALLAHDRGTFPEAERALLRALEAATRADGILQNQRLS